MLKQTARLLALAASFATFGSSPSYAANETGRLGQCARWGGGTSTEAQPERWRHPGYGLQFAYFGPPFYRTEVVEEFGLGVAWSAWMVIPGLLDGEFDSIVYTADTVWILHLENDRLVGRHLKLPVVRDRETQEPVSLVPDGELHMTLECLQQG